MVAALGAYAAARAGTLAPLAGALGLAGLVLTALALVGFVRLLGWGLVLAAGAYLLVDLARSLPLAAAPFYGAGLLLAAELAYASRELAAVPEEAPLRRVPWLAAVTVAALGVAFVPVAATGAPRVTGLAAELAALAAASAMLAIPAALTRRRAAQPGLASPDGRTARADRWIQAQEEPTTSG